MATLVFYELPQQLTCCSNQSPTAYFSAYSESIKTKPSSTPKSYRITISQFIESQ